ncbi:MAG: hypothetical protein A2Y50_06015 [Pseudomonadales bacterium RIFCSPLOWO2_12_59_9]|nr:MAG: hypothetical protein A2Y50_06015 [Pseudomonadales bacterium RIFCSPLOWO2_12_59_9]
MKKITKERLVRLRYKRRPALARPGLNRAPFWSELHFHHRYVVRMVALLMMQIATKQWMS